MDNYNSRLQMMEVAKMKGRVEEMYIKGVTNRNDIAARLGLDIQTVWRYVGEILDRWQLENFTRRQDMRAQAIRRLEKAAQLSMLSYERSRQDEEEVSTTSHSTKCPECKGGGMKGDTTEWCDECGGKGELMREVVTRKVKGQAGDAAHLRVFFDSVREVARLQGLYVRTDPRGRKGPSVNINVGAGSIVGLDLSNVPEDKLLDALSAMDVVMEAAKQKTLDVKSEDV